GNLAVGQSYFNAQINWDTRTNTNITTGRVVADPQGDGVFDVFGTNFYGEFGDYPIAVTITDLPGTTVTATGTAHLVDATLLPTPATVAGVAGTLLNGQFATFADSNSVGNPNDLSALINWGDNTTPTPATINSLGSRFGVSGSHLYKEAGTYTVLV